MSSTVMCLMAIGMALAALTAVLMQVPAFVTALKGAWASVSGYASAALTWVKGLFGSKS